MPTLARLAGDFFSKKLDEKQLNLTCMNSISDRCVTFVLCRSGPTSPGYDEIPGKSRCCANCRKGRPPPPRPHLRHCADALYMQQTQDQTHHHRERLQPQAAPLRRLPGHVLLLLSRVPARLRRHRALLPVLPGGWVPHRCGEVNVPAPEPAFCLRQGEAGDGLHVSAV